MPSLALLAFALATTAAPAVAGDFTVTMADGEVLRGELRLERIDLTTDFGTAQVRLDALASLRFGEPDVVTTTGGLVLEGEVGLARLRLVTAGGTRSLRTSEIASILAAGAGEARGFAGRWMTSYGPMELSQDLLEVEGSYGFDGAGRIEGRVVEGRLELEYRSPGGRGTGHFELGGDGASFAGQCKGSGGEGPWDWTGYRRERRLAEARPGEIVAGQSESGLNYWLRAPEGWDGARSFPAIAFFHGSNMSSRPYVETLASTWPELARDYLVVGFDGERMAASSTPDSPVHNFTYVNFSGHEVGEPWRHRQSPALVADALEELGAAFAVERWLAGGHSQGGFLTYALAMFYPQLVAGVFPMSCALLVQCEPTFFDDEPLEAAQREVAFAIVHGENDALVEFSSAVHAHESLQDGGFPRLRLFAHPSAGHSFMHLPVEEAVRWLEGMAAPEPEALAAFAEGCLAEDDFRGASAAALRGRALAPPAAVAQRLEAVLASVEERAAPRAAQLERALRANRDGAWVADFWDFRAHFALAPSAEGVLARYAELRAEHEGPADELFNRARQLGDRAEKRALWEEIVAEHYASRWTPLVRRWLED